MRDSISLHKQLIVYSAVFVSSVAGVSDTGVSSTRSEERRVGKEC